MNIQNKKYISKIITLIILTTIILFLFLKLNKYDLCISLVKYNYNSNFIEKNFSKKIKYNFINQVDRENREIDNYFRFTHNIIGTSSDNGKCQDNVENIIENLKKNDELSKFIENIYSTKTIEIEKILFFIISTLVISIYLFFFNFINFVRNEIKLKINKNKY